jgi:hypothetical protein
MGVPAGRQLDGAAGREAGTDERVESGLTTFLTSWETAMYVLLVGHLLVYLPHLLTVFRIRRLQSRGAFEAIWIPSGIAPLI